MKFPLAYYLLLLYTVACCKPFLPVVADVVAHTLWEANHLETVHHQKGSNHVQTAVKEAAAQEAADASATAGKNTEPLSVHIVSQHLFQFSPLYSRSQPAGYTHPLFKNPIQETHTPPPKSGIVLFYC